MHLRTVAFSTPAFTMGHEHGHIVSFCTKCIHLCSGIPARSIGGSHEYDMIYPHVYTDRLRYT